MNLIDLTGQCFGRLTVLSYAGQSHWLCQCDCGQQRCVDGAGLRNGETRSCGCAYRRHNNGRRHGHAGDGRRTRTYRSWDAMLQRCGNVNNTNYRKYGRRGIKVCERWQSFENFLADMGERPFGTSLDRFPDRNGNYEPDNCRWATPKQQSVNSRPRRQWSAPLQGDYYI